MPGRLEGKITLITGTAGGQGRAAALLFAREGATVVGCDLKRDEDKETAQQVQASGGTMTCDLDPVDLSDGVQARGWVEAARDAHGRLDVLYNNASSPVMAPFGELTEEQWRFTLANELDLLYHTCTAAWPALLDQNGGVILNTAAIPALIGLEGPGLAAHAAAKGGVIAFTRQLAVEGGRYGIRANSICPGLVETPMTAADLANPQVRAAMEANTLLRRLGTPEDIAYCALFLASDEASWVTGANFVIDGGWTAR